MVRRCGCANDICSCHFANSDTVQWQGSGSPEDPFTASAISLLRVLDTPTLDLELSISDMVATLSAYPISGSVDYQVFTANGTWNAPVGVSVCRVMLVGGGGGGQSGGKRLLWAGNGGQGGNAGQVAIFTLTGSDIPGSASIVVGAGGAGGAALGSATSTYTPGNPGADGGDTSFDTLLAPGGLGGGQPGPQRPGMPPGQSSVVPTQPFTNQHYYLAPGAGGRGVASNPANGPDRGGYSHPGQGSRYPADVGGGDLGQAGRDEPVTLMGGGGGGGDVSGAGGSGGLYGGGGGGGGFSTDGSSDNAGGDGAQGVCVVISW